MSEEKKSVVFFGTGPVAAKSLKSLAENFLVEMIVTKPKPVHHRGDWPVADLAIKLGISLSYANTGAEVETAVRQKKLASKVGIVIDFGLIISSGTIDQFSYGIINSHFSLLPRHRGADPITYTILEADKKAGVSLMKIVPGLDEGPIIAKGELLLEPKINSVELTKKLVALSNVMIRDNLPKYLNGGLALIDQSVRGINYSYKIKKQDGIINWSESADLIERKIRAYYSWPRSRTKINNMEIIITEAEVINKTGQAGKFNIDNKEITVFCGKKSLKILKLQPAGKKEMTTEEFLRGYKKN